MELQYDFLAHLIIYLFPIFHIQHLKFFSPRSFPDVYMMRWDYNTGWSKVCVWRGLCGDLDYLKILQ